MKLLSKILILLLVFSLVLTGCNAYSQEEETNQNLVETEAVSNENQEDPKDDIPPVTTDSTESTTEEDTPTENVGDSTTNGDETTKVEDDTTEGEDRSTKEEDNSTKEEEGTTKGEESTTIDPEKVVDLNPEPDSEISIKSAIAIGLTYASNKFSTDKFYVRGKIVSIEEGSKVNITIENSYGDSLYLYNTYSNNGESYSSMATKPRIGDTILVYGVIGQFNKIAEMNKGWIVEIEGITGDDFDGNDPYANMSATQFYANYKPATSWEDAYWRSKHYFMSGTIADQDQEPYTSQYQPTKDGLFIKNYSMLYSDDGNTYYVLDAYGDVAFEIYRGGAYIMLEEVAAYIFAFGDVPPNYNPNKKASPSSSPWGKYLRVNKTGFSGDTGNYPYEPELPDISGCGGKINYIEIDIGTTGTDCDPKYTPKIYNNGSSIERGAARIVYGRRDYNGNGKYEAGEIYVFYTYNHYNDFQEYLNYEGGWGEMFGNITGGGKISSKYDYNPTPYVEVAASYFATDATRSPAYKRISIYYIDTRALYYTSQMCA